MPFRTEWVEPELFVEHRGIRVYHTYKNADRDIPRTCWFTLDPLCGEDECNCAETPCLLVFDVRDLPNFREDDHPPFLVGAADNRANRRAWKKYQANGGEDAHFRRVIMEAIERKLFVPGVPIGRSNARHPKEDNL